MPITINVSMIDGGTTEPVANTTLHQSRITIGRDKECTLALDDPKKHVSRIHAELEEKSGSYWMKVVSKVNPVFVNKQRHNFGERVALATGDFLTVGTYRLELLIPVEEPADATMLYRGGSGVAAVPAAGVLEEGLSDELTYVRRPTIQKMIPEHKAEPAPALEKGLSAEVTYIPLPEQEAIPEHKAAPTLKKELSAEVTYIPLPEQEAIPEHKAAPALKKELSAELTYIPLPEQEAIPEHKAEPTRTPEEDLSDELTFVRRPEKKVVAPKPAPIPEADLSDELTFVRRPEKKEAAPKPAPIPEADLSDELTFVRRPEKKVVAPKPAPIPEADLSDELTFVRRPTTEDTIPQRNAEPARPAGEDLSEQITYVRPLAGQPQPGSATNTGSGTDASAQRVLQAFFQGAGLAPMEVADAEAFLRDSGMMVRAAVEGIMLLLSARNSALEELGVTLPVSASAHGNNPLKSMSDPREVIAFLFDPHQRTSAAHDPVQAFGDACADLRAHEMALLTSLRAAALKAVLSVDPVEFDREQGKNLSTFGMNRKSKLWDLFVAHHNQLAHGTRDGFKSQFGHDLTSAYVAHIRRLRGGH